MQFLEAPPRFLFFTGKGGVGKTSIACAAAVWLADRGRRVLLVSTDPASNVGQVFGITIGNNLTPVPSVAGLDALEIDPEQAAEAYRERIVGPVRDLLPAAEIAAITEQLSGSCTTEVAAFNEFTALLTDDEAYRSYDHIVFDTAPTGHTVRLLQLPGSWTDFLNEGKGDASCLGPLAGLDKRRDQYAQAVAALGDPQRTRLVLVSRAQPSALEEVERTYRELAAISILATHLVINAVLPPVADGAVLERAIRSREESAVQHLPAALADLILDTVPLSSRAMVGVDALRSLLGGEVSAAGEPVDAVSLPVGSLSELIAEVESAGKGLVLCMGKGGVGKTTIAAAIAVALAERGHDVHLTTTDPASHLHDVLPHEVAGLQVTRIDPVAATQQYRERVMATKGKNLDEQGRAHLAEDLMSPCTEEIAVFQQFSRVVIEGRRRFVVVDTAPTGHTLLLLDTAGAYHRDMVRQSGDNLGIHTPLMLLQDQDLTKVVLVTTPEPTPVSEAAALQQDLRRAGIEPWAWVVNTSLAAARPMSRLLRQRAQAEGEQFARITGLSARVAAVPLLAQEPVGPVALMQLAVAGAPVSG